MNREIKFRAWFAQQNRMIYLGSPKNDTALWIEERGWDAVDHLMGKPESICSNYNNENPENILMQYTGLKDKNGKEIYEGDIMSWRGNGNTDNTKLSCVIYEGAAFNVVGKTWSCRWNLDEYNESYEVIGNIHENPDLLK